VLLRVPLLPVQDSPSPGGHAEEVELLEDLAVKTIKCPDCGYLNLDIRELGHTLPGTCNRCSHIWRLQDVASPEDLSRLAKRIQLPVELPDE
jgi:uncharacterized paraquat-inducible protein A